MTASDRVSYLAPQPHIIFDPMYTSLNTALADGTYSPVLYALGSTDAESGFIRCVECGIVAVELLRVLQIRRVVYIVETIELLPWPITSPRATTPDRWVGDAIRGDSLAIEFVCAKHHGWWLELGNHKGVTVVQLTERTWS